MSRGTGTNDARCFELVAPIAGAKFDGVAGNRSWTLGNERVNCGGGLVLQSTIAATEHRTARLQLALAASK